MNEENRINDGGFAFPQPLVNTDSGIYSTAELCAKESGMSLRDYFAARAMQGAIAGYVPTMQTNYWSSESISKFSYELADAMLKARNQK